jgi:uncharacterized protein (DUF362 family)
MESKVALIGVAPGSPEPEIREALRKRLEMIGAPNGFATAGNTVVVKPNWDLAIDECNGVYTDLSVVGEGVCCSPSGSGTPASMVRVCE